MLSVAAALFASVSQPLAPRTYDNPAWVEKIAPFRIAEGLYYVGSRELAAYLVDGGDGLILLDAGVPEFAPTLLANIRALGFDPGRVRILLNSQAHLDHAGGLAAIKAATGARMLASAPDAALLRRGGKGDFAWGDALPYPPVAVDGLVRDGEKVRLGRAVLTAHITPGHTKGCTSWTLTVRERDRPYIAQISCSLSIPGYKLLGTAAYPDMAKDYARTFLKVRSLGCDIFLASHGSFFDMDRKRAAVASSSENPFVDPAGCRKYIAASEAAFRKQLARERAASKDVPKQ